MITSFVCENCKHHNKIVVKKERRRKEEQILYQTLTNIFNSIQEPTNLYEISKVTNFGYTYLNPIIEKHIALGNIQHVEYNFNKYMLTMKGRYILNLFNKLNEFITTWESDIVIPKLKTGRK
jgi:predicted transcriptional regulator